MSVDGRPLPGGSYHLSAQENERLCRALAVEPDPRGLAHPLFHYVATQAGIGISVRDLLLLCDFNVADGPLMTNSSVSIPRELRVEETYAVEGEITSLVRKPSRTFGTVDLLDFRLRLLDQHGLLTVDCAIQWVLPRRKTAGA